MNTNDQQFAAQKIRTQYIEKESTQLDALRALDTKVKRPANLFAGVFGTISALVMGAGMSLIMTDIGAIIGVSEPMVPGLVLGVAGMLMAIANYPIYTGVLKRRKQKYSAEILKLSDQIIGNQS